MNNRHRHTKPHHPVVLLCTFTHDAFSPLLLPPTPTQADFMDGRVEALVRERDDAVLALRTTKQCLASTTQSLDQLQTE